LIGWDAKNEKPLSVSSQMDNDECSGLFEENADFVPCSWINENSTMVVFLEFDNEDHAVSTVCLYDCESS